MHFLHISCDFMISNDLLEYMEDLIIENKDLQEENHTLKNDLKI